MFFIENRSSNGVDSVSGETRLLSNRKIFLEGNINQESAIEFAKKIMILSDSELPIHVYINSTGGEIDAGLLIYDVIQSCEVPIKLYCLGIAYSMAALIFLSGKHGRYMLPHSKLMLHEPLISGDVSSSATSLKKISDNLQDVRQMTIDIISKHIKKSKKTIENAISYDHYFTAQESLEFNLCDKVISFDEMNKGVI